MKHRFDGILRQPCSLCFAFQALQLVVQLSEDWLKSSPAVRGGSLKKYTDVFDHPQDDRTRRFFYRPSSISFPNLRKGLSMSYFLPNVGGKKSDSNQAAALSGVESTRPTKRYPIGTIATYGPTDRKITKIVAAVLEYENSKPILERWVSTTVSKNPKVQRQINALFVRHKVESVIKLDGNLGCPHEEGLDFPSGQDCPFCPYWAGKQGSAKRD